MQTYTPGYAKTKEVVCLLGLLIAAIGFWQFYPALHAVVAGESVYGTIVTVSKLTPGAPDVVYSTTQAIPTEENRNASFHYNVEFSDPSGALHTTRLNIVTKLNPDYHVSDSVKISYLRDKPTEVFATYDLGTWVAGSLPCLFGLALAIAVAMLRFHANRPIELPAGTPPFPGSVSSRP